MRFAAALVPLSLVSAAMATSCSTPVGKGSCAKTSSKCSGGGYIQGACPGASDVQCCVKGVGGGLPGLDETQSANAHEIISQTQKQKLGKQGCLAAITTGLTESSLLVDANSNVAESLKYPHNSVGSDHDSLGIFQQRYIYYPKMSADMNPAESAEQFFAEMVKVKGWKTMNVPKLCQEVQRSAFPDAYEKWYSAAEKICKEGGF